MKALGHYDLTRMIECQRRGFPLLTVARVGGYTVEQADLILYAKLGRSIPLTVDIVNSQGWKARAS